VLAKVGITAKPAERLYDIFEVFETLGEPQPLLRSLSRGDDPQTAVIKAKSINEIIFIEKVHIPGTAEKDIRTILQIGQPNLPQDFFPLFAAQVPKEKKGYLDVVGKTEWIIMESRHNGLADLLQWNFRAGSGIHKELRSLGRVPNGEELTGAVNKFCQKYHQLSSGIGPNGPPLPLVITFKATMFTISYGLDFESQNLRKF
jgi:hypothetical protein